MKQITAFILVLMASLWPIPSLADPTPCWDELLVGLETNEEHRREAIQLIPWLEKHYSQFRYASAKDALQQIRNPHSELEFLKKRLEEIQTRSNYQGKPLFAHFLRPKTKELETFSDRLQKIILPRTQKCLVEVPTEGIVRRHCRNSTFTKTLLSLGAGGLGALITLLTTGDISTAAAGGFAAFGATQTALQFRVKKLGFPTDSDKHYLQDLIQLQETLLKILDPRKNKTDSESHFLWLTLNPPPEDSPYYRNIDIIFIQNTPHMGAIQTEPIPPAYVSAPNPGIVVFASKGTSKGTYFP